MDEVNVICWLWGSKYTVNDVVRLANAVRKNLSLKHRFHVFSDVAYSLSGIETHLIRDPALANRSCFCRLRMFDPNWQASFNMKGWILSLDLDLIILGSLDNLPVPYSTFKILQNVNAVNPNPFNASIMLLKVGCHPEVWQDFSLEKAAAIKFHEFPDDQGWIWHMLPDADGWTAGSESGIYGFQKPGWPSGFNLPDDARIVAFIGKRKPSMYYGLPWVRKYWT